MNSNQTVLSPQELFNRLATTDFKPSECEDQATKLKQQRQVLIQLICEYEEEIKKAHMMAIEEQQLIDLKERLLIELQALKNQRVRIDSRLSQDINALKVAPVELRDHESWMAQITDSRSRNSALKVRIKDLMIYIEKLEIQNRRLEEEKKILQANDLQRFQMKDDWRHKIDLLQKQYLSYETELRDRIRLKEEETLRKAQAQQLEIQQRNERRRLQSLSGSVYRGVPRPIQYPYVRRI